MIESCRSRCNDRRNVEYSRWYSFIIQSDCIYILAYADSRFNRSVDMKTGFRTRNILCVPMRNATGEVIGVTQVINKIPDFTGFIKDDEQQLTSFSALVATTIEKSRVFKALSESLEETTKAKAHLQASLNSCTMVIITLDSDGRLVYPNSIVLRLIIGQYHSS